MPGTATGGVMTVKDMEVEIERRVALEMKRLEKAAAGFVITTFVYGRDEAEQDGTFLIQIHKGPYQNKAGDIVEFLPQTIPCFNGRAFVRDPDVAEWIGSYYGYKVAPASGTDALVIAMAVEQAAKKIEAGARVL